MQSQCRSRKQKDSDFTSITKWRPVCKALSKMKWGKASGPSGIIAKMLKAAGEGRVELVRKVVEVVFSSCMISTLRKPSIVYHNAQSRVRVNGQYSEEFGVRIGVPQGSVLSPLIFILGLEALSCSFALLCHGSCSMRMIWCSTWTPRRSVSPNSRHGRLAWKVKGPMSAWRRPSS